MTTLQEEKNERDILIKLLAELTSINPNNLARREQLTKQTYSDVSP